MTFRELTELTKDHTLPIDATNENGEFVIIEAGSQDSNRYFRLTTAQNNGWCRINYFYEDGSYEELYEK